MALLKAYTYTVNNVGDREPITVNNYCQTVTIQESPSVADWPTQGFNLSTVASGGDVAQYSPGIAYTFPMRRGGQLYQPGEILAYIETLSGATTFQQIEALP